MSKTPRTDAEALRIINIDTPNRERVDDYHDMFVFARGLERELAAAVKLNEEFWPSTLATRDELRVTKEQLAASQARCKELEKQVESLKAENESCCARCEHYDAKMEECKDDNILCNYTPKVMYRCADRDDGCGHCPRSEPHTHPDEESGDECYRRTGRVTCERVT